MIQLPFNPDALLLIFPCQVEYQQSLFLDLALDTGASTTLISERAAKEIGYDLAQISHQVSFSNASSSHIVPMVTLKSLSLGPAKVENIEALCYTLPEECGIDGLIGLNFLRHFKVTLDFSSGLLTLEYLRYKEERRV